MAFFGAVARFIAVDKLRSLGQDVLAAGRRRFAEEMGRGRSKEEAARIAAKFMLKLAGTKGLSSIKGAAKGAASGAGRAAAQAGRALRKRMKG